MTLKRRWHSRSGSDAGQSTQLKPEVTHQPRGFCCAGLPSLWADESFWTSFGPSFLTSTTASETDISKKSQRLSRPEYFQRVLFSFIIRTALHCAGYLWAALPVLGAVVALQWHRCFSSPSPWGIGDLNELMGSAEMRVSSSSWLKAFGRETRGSLCMLRKVPEV